MERKSKIRIMNQNRNICHEIKMTKLHLQLILHPYPGDKWFSMSHLESPVPDDCAMVMKRNLCALQTTKDSFLAFCRLQSSVPFSSDAF
ncbi:CLUMA_CG018115, isoform A [Clunio marinus]|uniref:CLUMA_CG018115, isoform A n=1 Tax=Clunio marinus TaxID=568069 RepID=A0A1J1J2Y6_9DIPT|nr:CLUMA_CG018115, isoform A [Clunio marinus]